MADVPVIEFAAATLDSGVTVDLTLDAGELVLIDHGGEQNERVMADAACGLTNPVRGSVRMLGRDWRRLPPDLANALRGRIGHGFRPGAWISYLSVIDNIMLAQLHHTMRPEADIRDEASRLSVAFGLPGVPTGLPSDCAPGDLARADLVRAFMGSPALVILEGPPADLTGALINMIRTVRDRGTAAVWFTLDPDLWHDKAIPASQRCRLRGSVIAAARDRP
ncbi:organic solvent ABC transporter ATP-binding protein [Azospirillum sp. TSO22-1]|uniref:organic solvent ABC transporter ATP-binding protein n=1 Tax=Azospirillum sp. TSO22-1 TaxID=716789 RepID=UPI000D64384A|nr:organic solvent ABC transporter ATP-binding protein [Azospirillum sp. TSO22-1]